MFVQRIIPNDVKTYTLTSSGGYFGMVKLGKDVSNDISNIDDHESIFIENEKINIYFPAWDYFYRDEIISNDKTFKLKDVLKMISNVGYIACGESWIRDKSIFKKGTTFASAASSVDEFCICEFEYKDNNIYVTCEH